MSNLENSDKQSSALPRESSSCSSYDSLGATSQTLWHPPICVTTRDRSRVLALLSAEGCRARHVVRLALTRKLWRATICVPESIPVDIVTM